MSMSGLLFPPSHWRAFSVVGRAAMRSKFRAAEGMLAFSVAGSSNWIVTRERNRSCGKEGNGLEGIGLGCISF